MLSAILAIVIIGAGRLIIWSLSHTGNTYGRTTRH